MLKKLPLVSRLIRYEEQKVAVQVDTLSLSLLRQIDVPWMPWTSSSIRPSSIRAILNEIDIHGRKSFVEFGCGISTLYLADAAKRVGGHLVSIEENAEWIEIMRKHLITAGTIRFVTLLHVPINNSADAWYDRVTLERNVGSQLFDLALVDAPISKESGSCVRHPAGDFLRAHVSPEFCIFLDDINRLGESRIADAWAKTYGWRFSSNYPLSGVGVFRPKLTKSTYNIF